MNEIEHKMRDEREKMLRDSACIQWRRSSERIHQCSWCLKVSIVDPIAMIHVAEKFSNYPRAGQISLFLQVSRARFGAPWTRNVELIFQKWWWYWSKQLPEFLHFSNSSPVVMTFPPHQNLRHPERTFPHRIQRRLEILSEVLSASKRAELVF
jgi:hypothetical protein